MDVVDLIADEESHPRIEHVRQALELIADVQPWRVESLRKDLRRILIIKAGGELYDYVLKACVLDSAFLKESPVVVIAGMLVHEGTHARLWHMGYRYGPSVRDRIEQIAAGTQIDFLERLPGGEPFARQIRQRLSQPWWTDDDVLERRLQQMKTHGFPAWTVGLYRWFVSHGAPSDSIMSRGRSIRPGHSRENAPR